MGESGTSVVVSRAAATANDRAVERSRLWEMRRLREAIYGGMSHLWV